MASSSPPNQPHLAASNTASSWSAAEKQAIGRELSGVLLYVIRIADVCGVDLGRAALDKVSAQEAL